jgi:hypothetical protein
MNSEALPTKLLKVTERFYGRTFYTGQEDMDRSNQRGVSNILCCCRSGKLVARYHVEMGWSGRSGVVFHRQYLEGATIEEISVLPAIKGKELL